MNGVKFNCIIGYKNFYYRYCYREMLFNEVFNEYMNCEIGVLFFYVWVIKLFGLMVWF